MCDTHAIRHKNESHHIKNGHLYKYSLVISTAHTSPYMFILFQLLYASLLGNPAGYLTIDLFPEVYLTTI